MKLDLDRLDSGRSDVEVTVTIATEAAEIGPATVELTGSLQIDDVGGRVLVGGELLARGETTCDRCLDDFVQEFPVPVKIVILRDGQGPESEEELDGSLIEQRGGFVDLGPGLREAVVLAMPTRRMPPEDENGRCTLCERDFSGENEEEEEGDPRWDALP